MNVSEMMKRAAENLAQTAGRWNDAMKTGDNDGAKHLNDAYMEKSALLREMGFAVVTEADEDGYPVAVTVDCPADITAKGERAEVRGLFAERGT